MLEAYQVEELICLASSLDRKSITKQFLNFQGSFPVDFTPDFLQSLPLDRLRHIFVALCLQAQHVPEMDVMTAA